MIADVPSPQDFFDSGIQLFDFAWNTVAELITTFSDAELHFGVDVAEVSEDYWASAKRRLTTALAVTQQGVEFILKGKIAEVTPYLLLAESPSKWPTPYGGRAPTFSEFRTVDAQDLMRLHDTVRDPQLSADFRAKFDTLRTKRNTTAHSIDKRLQVSTAEVIEAILFLHKALFPAENWANVRAKFIERYPDATLHGGDFSRNNACRELEVVFGLLTPAAVKNFFGVDKRQHLYICPGCYELASHDGDFHHRVAMLRPNGPHSTALYCPICDGEHQVLRDRCDNKDCPGDVLVSEDDRMCLTCGGTGFSS